MNFQEVNFYPTLTDSVKKRGYTVTTPIQLQASYVVNYDVPAERNEPVKPFSL